MMAPLEAIPMRVDTSQYAQLKALCWNRSANTTLTGEEAHALYERNWRFIDVKTLSPKNAR